MNEVEVIPARNFAGKIAQCSIRCNRHFTQHFLPSTEEKISSTLGNTSRNRRCNKVFNRVKGVSF